MSTGDAGSDGLIADYFYTRIWAVPAGIMLFAFNGWLTGMQNAVVPMAVAILVNVLHIGCSYLFSIVGTMDSPILGGDGNKEYLAVFKRS